MFGISWAEFFVILLVATLVIPARAWPDVARFIARAVKMVRRVIWKITDSAEEITRQIDMENPIDEVLRTTTTDVLNEISVPLKRVRRNPTKQTRGRAKK